MRQPRVQNFFFNVHAENEDEALDTAHQLISPEVQIFSFQNQKFGVFLSPQERHRASVELKGDVIKCNDNLKHWLVSIFEYILNCQEGKIKDNLIFAPRQQVLEYPNDSFQWGRRFTEIPYFDLPYCDWNKTFPNELIWIRKKTAIPDQSPILTFCVNGAKLYLDVFSQRNDGTPYCVKTRHLYTKETDKKVSLIYLSSINKPEMTSNTLPYSTPTIRLIPSGQPGNVLPQSPQISTSGEVTTSIEQQAQPPAGCYFLGIDQYVHSHLNRSKVKGMTTVLVSVDSSGQLHNMEKIRYEDGNLTVKPVPNSVVNKINEIKVITPSSVENNNNSTNDQQMEKDKPMEQSSLVEYSAQGQTAQKPPCSQQTKSKLKAKLETNIHRTNTTTHNSVQDTTKSSLQRSHSSRKPKVELSGRWADSVSKLQQKSSTETENNRHSEQLNPSSFAPANLKEMNMESSSKGIGQSVKKGGNNRNISNGSNVQNNNETQIPDDTRAGALMGTGKKKERVPYKEPAPQSSVDEFHTTISGNTSTESIQVIKTIRSTKQTSENEQEIERARKNSVGTHTSDNEKTDYNSVQRTNSDLDTSYRKSERGRKNTASKVLKSSGEQKKGTNGSEREYAESDNGSARTRIRKVSVASGIITTTNTPARDQRQAVRNKSNKSTEAGSSVRNSDAEGGNTSAENIESGEISKGHTNEQPLQNFPNDRRRNAGREDSKRRREKNELTINPSHEEEGNQEEIIEPSFSQSSPKEHDDEMNGENRQEHLAKSKKLEVSEENSNEPSLTQSSPQQNVRRNDRRHGKELPLKSKKQEAIEENRIEPSLTQSSSDQQVDGSDEAHGNEQYTNVPKSTSNILGSMSTGLSSVNGHEEYSENVLRSQPSQLPYNQYNTNASSFGNDQNSSPTSGTIAQANQVVMDPNYGFYTSQVPSQVQSTLISSYGSHGNFNGSIAADAQTASHGTFSNSGVPTPSFSNFPSGGLHNGGYLSEILNTDGSSQPIWISSRQRNISQQEMNRSMEHTIQITFRIPRQEYNKSEKEMPLKMSVNTQLPVDLAHNLQSSHGNQPDIQAQLGEVESNSWNGTTGVQYVAPNSTSLLDVGREEIVMESNLLTPTRNISTQTSKSPPGEDEHQLSNMSHHEQSKNKYKLTLGQHGKYKCEKNPQGNIAKRKAVLNSDKDTTSKRRKQIDRLPNENNSNLQSSAHKRVNVTNVESVKGKRKEMDASDVPLEKSGDISVEEAEKRNNDESDYDVQEHEEDEEYAQRMKSDGDSDEEEEEEDKEDEEEEQEKYDNENDDDESKEEDKEDKEDEEDEDYNEKGQEEDDDNYDNQGDECDDEKDDNNKGHDYDSDDDDEDDDVDVSGLGPLNTDDVDADDELEYDKASNHCDSDAVLKDDEEDGYQSEDELFSDDNRSKLNSSSDSEDENVSEENMTVDEHNSHHPVNDYIDMDESEPQFTSTPKENNSQTGEEWLERKRTENHTHCLWSMVQDPIKTGWLPLNQLVLLGGIAVEQSSVMKMFHSSVISMVNRKCNPELDDEGLALQRSYGKLILEYVIDHLTETDVIIQMDAWGVWHIFYLMLNSIGTILPKHLVKFDNTNLTLEKTSHVDPPSESSESESDNINGDEEGDKSFTRSQNDKKGNGRIFSDQDIPSLKKNYVKYGRSKVHSSKKDSMNSISPMGKVKSIGMETTFKSGTKNGKEQQMAKKIQDLKNGSSTQKQPVMEKRTTDGRKKQSKAAHGRHDNNRKSFLKSNASIVHEISSDGKDSSLHKSHSSVHKSQLQQRNKHSNQVSTDSKRQMQKNKSEKYSEGKSSKRNNQVSTGKKTDITRKEMDNEHYTDKHSGGDKKRKDVYNFDGISLDHSYSGTDNNTRSPEKNERKMHGRTETKVEMSKFVMNASRNPDSSDEDEIRSKKPAYQVQSLHYSSKFTNPNEVAPGKKLSRKDHGLISHSTQRKLQYTKKKERYGEDLSDSKAPRTQNTTSSAKRQDSDIRNRRPPSTSTNGKPGNRKKPERHPLLKDNAHYFTDNINSDSLHAESDYGDEDSHENTVNRLVPGYPQKAQSALQNRHHISAGDFESDCSTHTSQSQQKPKKKGKSNPNNDVSQKKSQIKPKGKKNNSDTNERWPDKDLHIFLDTVEETPDKEMTAKKMRWVMFAKRLKEKGLEKTNDQCRLQMVAMNRYFDKYNRQTGAGNRMNELQIRIIDVLSRYKHARADVTGSSSGKGIQESKAYKFQKKQKELNEAKSGSSDDDFTEPQHRRHPRGNKDYGTSSARKRQATRAGDGSYSETPAKQKKQKTEEESNASEEKSKKTKKRFNTNDVIQEFREQGKELKTMKDTVCNSLNTLTDIFKKSTQTTDDKHN